VLKVVQTDHEGQLAAADVPAGSLLDEIAREGARRMLADALRAEGDAYVDGLVDQVDEDGHRLVVRNGHHERRSVLCAAGAIEVRAPRVNDKRIDEACGERKRFASAILPAGAAARRRSATCCRCCICTACPVGTSCRRWSSSSARAPACRPVGLDGDPAVRAVARRATRVRQA
jgi:hypothetical protein